MTDQSILDLSPPKRKDWILKQEDWQRQTALWACEFGFDLLVPQNEPNEPLKVQEYNRLPNKDRFAMSANPSKYLAFWLNDDVKAYFDKKKFAKVENKTNKLWLEQIRSWLLPEDKEQIDMITERLIQFEEKPEYKKYTPYEQKVRNVFESEEE